MYTLKIKVTKEILEKSKFCGGKSDSCAFALAVRDIFPTARVFCEVIVPIWAEKMCYAEAHKLAFPLPATMQDFISDFDSAKPEERVKMSEQEFELEIPDAVIEQIDITEVKKVLQNHPTLSLI